MTTIQTRDASIYWGTGTPQLISETRNFSIDTGADFVDDTVHGDVNRSFAPLFGNFNAKITGLWDITVGKSDELYRNAANHVSGKFSLYVGDSNRYFYGSAYISVDEVGAPYDDFAPFNWSLKPTATVGLYAK